MSTAMAIGSRAGWDQVRAACHADGTPLAVLFYATWHEPSMQMRVVVDELGAEHPSIRCVSVDADAVADVASELRVQAVPTVVTFLGDAETGRVEGANVPDVVQLVSDASRQSSPAPAACQPNTDLEQLVRRHRVMLFMKGSPAAPQCGFSRSIVDLLNSKRCPYGHFDILKDDDVRQGLKAFANWQTYPQLWVDGQLVGGLDVVREMDADGDLDALLREAPAKSLNDRLKSLIASSPVMLFMKGSPTEPRCGFSKRIVDVLTERRCPFGHFDILQDNDVREGLKAYSNWPTYPQLYVNGALLGGLDIVTELADSGELDDALSAA